MTYQIVAETARSKRWMVRLFAHVPCHRKTERCFCIKGEPMPICSRCLSMLIGLLTVPFFLFFPLPLWAGILLQMPMIADGWSQLKGWRNSTNTLRTVTGLGSGVGLAVGITSLFWMTAGWINSI